MALDSHKFRSIERGYEKPYSQRIAEQREKSKDLKRLLEELDEEVKIIDNAHKNVELNEEEKSLDDIMDRLKSIHKRTEDIDQKWIRKHESDELNRSHSSSSKFHDINKKEDYRKSVDDMKRMIDSLPVIDPVIPEKENLLDEIDAGRSL